MPAVVPARRVVARRRRHEVHYRLYRQDAYGKGSIHVENYILRIYRREEHHPDRVVGIVEDVENGETVSFRSLSQLMAFLAKHHSLDIERETRERV